jgi:hypothetical protein
LRWGIHHDVFGPNLPFTSEAFAATQLHQTGRWCIAQHFQLASGGTAD